MTNGEFYLDDIKNIIDRGYQVEILDGKPVICDGSRCETCYRNYDTGKYYMCSDLKFVEWYNSEYIPTKPKLTKYEKAALSLLEKGFMVRDGNGILYFYKNIPSRKRDEWCSNGGSYKRMDLGITEKAKFQFIKWQDEPISIEEMLTWEVDE